MEEKMLILKMLQESKITTDDALKLLEALEKSNIGTAQPSSRINDIKDELSAKLNEIKIDEKLNKFGEKASKLAETFGEKAGELAKQLGENINPEKFSNSTEKFTEEFSEKMESFGQDIADSASKFADAFTNQFGSLFDNAYEKYKYNSSFTYPATEDFSVYLATNNFSVKLIPGNTKEIKINISVNSNIPHLVIDEYFKTIKDNTCFKFSSEFPGRTWGKLEIQLPTKMKDISVSTENAKCEVNSINADRISCSTTNGRITVTKCIFHNIEILTDNEKIVIDKVTAKSANIRTSNSKIEIEDSSLENIDAKTSNGAIIVDSLKNGDSLTSSYILSTSNGKIDVGMIETEGCEHLVDAHTSMSSIDVNLSNLKYKTDKKNIGGQSTIKIKSENYDTSPNKIVYKINTSNAPIILGNI